MCISSSAGSRHHSPKDSDTGKIMFEVGIAPIPQANPSAPKAVSQGPSLCIFNQSNDAEELASWLFVKFLTTNVDFQAEFSMTSGYMPVSKAAIDHPVFREYLSMANGYEGLLMLGMKVAFGQTDSFFVAPAFNGCAVARDEVGYLLMRCMTDPAANTAAGIKKAFEDAIKECKYIIGES
jgi:ABC-type glycerol-3-phosphate transport system substrate-binding protein